MATFMDLNGKIRGLEVAFYVELAYLRLGRYAYSG